LPSDKEETMNSKAISAWLNERGIILEQSFIENLTYLAKIYKKKWY
jgi:hypothetical protein